MKIDLKNSNRRLSFLCHLPDIQIVWINPWFNEAMFQEILLPSLGNINDLNH